MGKNFYDKVVLITGGTSGIGLGTIQYLLENGGYKVISLSREKEKLNSVKKILGEKYKDVDFLFGDVCKIEDCKRVFDFISSKYNRLDGLVNSAGIIKLGGIEEQTLEQWEQTINTNLTSIFILTQGLLPLLKRGKNASIVNISSMSSQKADGSIAYCVSKAGVDMITKYLAMDLAKYNIRVNSVNPGAVYTNIYVASGDFTQEEYDKISDENKKWFPLGRIGNAKKDIAPTIELLLSEKSLWTTGANYLVDGGGSL